MGNTPDPFAPSNDPDIPTPTRADLLPHVHGSVRDPLEAGTEDTVEQTKGLSLEAADDASRAIQDSATGKGTKQKSWIDRIPVWKEFGHWLKWASASFAFALGMTQINEYGLAWAGLAACGMCCLLQIYIWMPPQRFRYLIKSSLAVLSVALVILAAYDVWKIKGDKTWSNLQSKLETVKVTPAPASSPVELRPQLIVTPTPAASMSASPKPGAFPTASIAATPAPGEPSPPTAEVLNAYEAFQAHKAVANLQRTFAVRPSLFVTIDIPVKIDNETYWPEVAGHPLVIYVGEGKTAGQDVYACLAFMHQFKEIRQEMADALQQLRPKDNLGIANAIIIYHAAPFTSEQEARIQQEARYNHIEVTSLKPPNH